MKKIVIEITDEQHHSMIEFIKMKNKINLDNETFSGFGINLNCAEGFSWLEIDFNGIKELGDVNWKIEESQ